MTILKDQIIADMARAIREIPGMHDISPEQMATAAFHACMERLKEPDSAMKDALVSELSDATVSDPKAAAWDALRGYKAMLSKVME